MLSQDSIFYVLSVNLALFRITQSKVSEMAIIILASVTKNIIKSKNYYYTLIRGVYHFKLVKDIFATYVHNFWSDMLGYAIYDSVFCYFNLVSVFTL